MNNYWAKDAFFYHIYPLGLCGAPLKNDFKSEPVPRIEKLYGWINHIAELGADAVYLGPLFESSEHGYDTADYFKVDRRLGTNNNLKDFIAELHSKNIRVILDGVFNHVGRDFWAFKDVQANLSNSAFCGWFSGLSFNGTSPFNDPFLYEGWNGHYNLVKLNLMNDDVMRYLFDAVKMWIDEFEIDGLRLDAADCLDKNFIKRFVKFCKNQKDDFWLMGEVIHGDYRNWAGREMLDSVTNYECYKGLFSSHNDNNYFEIAYSFNRLFGAEGIYKDISLYNFADNHDVDRVASSLTSHSHLYPLYFLLFTMPGIPSVYYGSEFGIAGKKTNNSDLPLRPCIELNEIVKSAPQPGLFKAIKQLAGVRKRIPALRTGTYKQVYLQHQQFAFLREKDKEAVLVAVNSSNASVEIEHKLPDHGSCKYIDQMTGEEFYSFNGSLKLVLWPNWGRILVRQK
jgi:cyclomaltodextrinase / maltogenic alpha-amylase / neopullulanase